jgi:RNA processing factor Prp31
MDFKREEIKEYFNDWIKENDEDIYPDKFGYYNQYSREDLHHNCFNTDYFIIGTYKANQWLENQIFNVINFIKEYEMDNFGEVTTDFSSSEKVVNMYVYIIGEDIVHEYKEKNNLW